jgi:hypothetical protein
MPVLHLGVADIPYTEAPPLVRRGRRPKKQASHTTTGDVAEILEDKYHIMQIFFEQHKKDIVGLMTDSMTGALENMLSGAPSSVSPHNEGASKIETLFKRFLSNREMDALGYPGVPTEASLMGVSHRFKGKRSGGTRPSFVDTGQYEASMKAWVD